jgi:tetratricopeptide (TPR) repeat protein
MPTAKFIADFSSFDAAVAKSSVTLKNVEADANKVGKALNSMVDNFSGRKLINDAVLMTKAVEDVGGASKLTATEMAKVNGVVTEAIAKYAALGKTAPQSMIDLAKATQTTQSYTASFGQEILKTAAGFVTAQAIIGAVTGVVKLLGNELVTLTVHGAAVGDVSENFAHLAEQSGHLGDTLLGVLRAGTHSTITDFDLMKTANQDLAAGMNLTDQQFGTLAKGAFALAQATGGDVKTGLDTMNDAMLTGRTRALALLTGKINLTDSEQKYAQSLLSTADHLTEEGKLEAARAAILEAVALATGRLGEQTDGLDELIAQAGVAWQNFEDQLGKSIATSATLITGLEGVKKILQETFGSQQEELIKAIVEQVNKASVALVDFAIAGVTAANEFLKGWKDVRFLFDNIQQVLEYNELSAAKLGRRMRELWPGDQTAALQLFTDKINALSRSMDERAARLLVESKAQSNADAVTAGYVKTLEDLKGKMVAAGIATNGFVGPIEAATVAGKKHEAQLQASKEELSKAQAAAEKFAKASQNLSDILDDTDWDGTIEGALRLGVSAGDVATFFGKSEGAIKKFQMGMAAADKQNEKAQDTLSSMMGTLRSLGTVIPQSEFDDFAKSLAKLPDIERGIAMGFIEAGKAGGWVVDVNDDLKEFEKQAKIADERTKQLANTFGQMGQIVGGTFGAMLAGLGQLIPMIEAASKAQEVLNTKGPNATEAERMNAALTKRQAVMAGILTAATAVANVTEGLDSTLGKMANFAAKGAALGAAFGPWGALAGAVGGAIVGAFQKAEQAINKTRAAFVEAAGGLDKLRDKATAAGVTIDALLQAKNAKQYEAAIKDLNDAFKDYEEELKKVAKLEEVIGDRFTKLQGAIGDASGAMSDSMRDAIRQLSQLPGVSKDVAAALQSLADDTKPNFEELTKIAKDYGIELENLGPKFQQAHISDEALKLITNFENLRNAGADVGGVINGMADEINKVVQDSLKFKVDIPENMRFMIEALINSNQLFDEQGNLIKDIADLKFGAPVETEADKIVKAIEALGDILKLLPGIADKAASGIQDALNNIHPPTIYVPVVPAFGDFNVPGGASGGVFTGKAFDSFSGGGVKGRVLPFRPPPGDDHLAWMAKGEGVLTVSEMHALGGVSGFNKLRADIKAGRSSGGDTSALETKLDEIRAELRRNRLTGPAALARAVRDEVQKAGGRRR